MDMENWESLQLRMYEIEMYELVMDSFCARR